MLPPLVDLLQILAAGGGIIGGLIGLAFPAKTDGAIVTNIANGAACGALAGSTVAFAIWIGGTVAGG